MLTDLDGALAATSGSDFDGVEQPVRKKHRARIPINQPPNDSGELDLTKSRFSIN